VTGGERTSAATGERHRRLLYISLQAAPPGSAAGTHVHAICDGLADHRWQVDLITPPHRGRVSPVARVAGWVLVFATALVRLQAADAVYVRSHPAALPVSLLSRWLRIPVVQEVNGPYDDYLLAHPGLSRATWLLRWAIRLQLRRSQSTVAVTDGLAEWTTQEAAGTNVVVVPNGVDFTQFHPTATSTLSVPSRYVVFVGTLTPWQGLPTLLEATRAPDWPDDVSLVVAGDGTRRRDVERAVEEMPHRVLYLGHVAHENVPGLLAQSMAAIVTSLEREGTGLAPLKLFEAMAAGTPVVGFDIAGVRDVVRGASCGELVPPLDAAALAGAVASIAEDGSRAADMGCRGRTAAVDHHSWDERATRTAQLLDTLVANRG
jgi:glycosyltransferase involved in cell wall biosynthesis